MVRVCVEGYRDGEEGRNVASFVGGWLPLGAQTPPLSRILTLTLCASVQQHGYGAAYGANGQRGRWDAQASKRIQDAPRDGYVITHVHSEQPGAGWRNGNKSGGQACQACDIAEHQYTICSVLFTIIHPPSELYSRRRPLPLATLPLRCQHYEQIFRSGWPLSFGPLFRSLDHTAGFLYKYGRLEGSTSFFFGCDCASSMACASSSSSCKA